VPKNRAWLILVNTLTGVAIYDIRRANARKFYDHRRMTGQLSPPSRTLLGRRLRDVRLRAGIAQDKLGVMIGLDEGCSSTRMSRYESGIHEPPFATIEQIAKALGVAACYFYCRDEHLAELILDYSRLSEAEQKVCQLSVITRE
jgi:transcriptional regulator with XRE-family HTH domain